MENTKIAAELLITDKDIVHSMAFYFRRQIILYVMNNIKWHTMYKIYNPIHN